MKIIYKLISLICKRQIIDAYNQGYRDGQTDTDTEESPDIADFCDAELYYKSIFE